MLCIGIFPEDCYCGEKSSHARSSYFRVYTAVQHMYMYVYLNVDMMEIIRQLNVLVHLGYFQATVIAKEYT